MRKLSVLLIASFLFNYSFSQARIGTKGIDSIENVINQTFKNGQYFTDSGRIYNEDSSKVIGSFKKTFYINKITGNLDMVLYGKRLTSGTSVYESFYYSNNKPMTAYRMTVIPKNLRPEVRFLVVGNTYVWKDGKLTLSTDKIKTTALKLLEESKNYHW